MSTTFPVLVVGPDPGDAQTVQEMLVTAGNRSFAVEHAGSLLDALDRLGRITPGVILLDLALPDSRGLETVMTVRAQAPGIPILVWTDLDSDQLAHGAVQVGADDYLVKHRLTASALARAVEYAFLRRGSRTPENAAATEAVVIGVMGAKGGVGTTTLACHLSAELRRITSQDVLLADCDLYAGQIAFLMKAVSPYSILDAANNLQRLDRDYCACLTARGAEGVDVIRAPGPAGMENAQNVARIRHVFRILRRSYRWIVIDLARLSLPALDLVKDLNQILLVTTSEVQSLFGAKQVLDRLAAIDTGKERRRLVLNRAGNHAVLSKAEIERIVGEPFSAALPNNYAVLSKAYGEGKLLPATANLRQQIGNLASKIAGMEQVQKKKSRFAMLNFLNSGIAAGTPEAPSEA